MPETTLLTGDNVKLLRELTGMGMMDCKKALQLADADEFGGDVALAFWCVYGNGLAINVKGDNDARHRWNLNYARGRADEWRQNNPDFDAAFPKPSPGPQP